MVLLVHYFRKIAANSPFSRIYLYNLFHSKKWATFCIFQQKNPYQWKIMENFWFYQIQMSFLNVLSKQSIKCFSVNFQNSNGYMLSAEMESFSPSLGFEQYDLFVGGVCPARTSPNYFSGLRKTCSNSLLQSSRKS